MSPGRNIRPGRRVIHLRSVFAKNFIAMKTGGFDHDERTLADVAAPGNSTAHMTLKNHFSIVHILAAFLFLVTVFPVAAQITDWQKPEPYRGEEVGEPGEFKEDEFQLPDVAVASDWVEFHVGAETRNRYFVARGSLAIGKDEVTRFVSRVLTAGGAENVSVEAIRCATAERRLYAYLRAGQGWVVSRDKRWSSVVTGNRFNAYRYALFDGLVCSAERPVKPPEALDLMVSSFKARTGTPLTGYR